MCRLTSRLRQLDLFEAVGVNPAHVAIGHVCCLDDPKAAVAIALAKRGAYVAFDRVTRQQQWVSDEHRLHMIMAFLEAGHIDRLLLSSDYIGRVNTGVGEISVSSRPAARADGGPGYARPLGPVRAADAEGRHQRRGHPPHHAGQPAAVPRVRAQGAEERRT